MKRTIKKRLILYFGLLLFVAFLSITVLGRFAVKSFLSNQLSEEFKEEMQIIQQVFKEELSDLSRDNHEALLTQVAQALKSGQRRISVLGLDSQLEMLLVANGNIRSLGVESALPVELYTVVSEQIDNNNFGQLFLLKDEINQIDYQAYVTSVTMTEKQFNAIAQSEDRLLTKQRLYALILLDQSEVTTLVNRFSIGLGAIVLLVYLISLIMIIFIASKMTRPIKVLQKMSDDIGNRRKINTANIQTKDELQDLAEAMNVMAVKINAYHEEQLRYLQNASHELKTPLTSIQGYSEAILDGVVDNEVDALNIIIDESVRLKNIVSGLTLLSKLETGAKQMHFEAIQIDSVLNNVMQTIEPVASQGNIKVQIRNRLDPVLQIKGDKDSLIQCFVNLLSNGVRYASELVVITIDRVTIEQVPSQMRHGEKIKWNGQDYIKISIADDGQGISEKDIPHVFERFYKGKSGQTGLGLAITKAIVEQHSGMIHADNSYQFGAVFDVYLPII